MTTTTTTTGDFEKTTPRSGRDMAGEEYSSKPTRQNGSYGFPPTLNAGKISLDAIIGHPPSRTARFGYQDTTTPGQEPSPLEPGQIQQRAKEAAGGKEGWMEPAPEGAW
ncbi:hypothetical protein MKZ38_002451 [Zalerion maritima]|uniref:Uncharacterized protein n=1 Tax=Zalerion maritima TaxID=339359 RepID=A0AAD5REZ0_9PEZI|nr:hypothetical protein MKZ38_002451 [Zalerion maritima]